MYIRECWKDDKKLLDKWHIKSGEGVEKIIDYTVDVITNYVDKTTFNFYKIKDGSLVIGFFGHEIFDSKPFLTTFGIKPEHRNEETKNKVFNIIAKSTGGKFTTFLYSKNAPAIRWLKKKGATIDKSFIVEGDEVVSLTFKTE